ncbi:MAG: hypothetical protein N2508_11835 [Anaerolineae bacterium]|nr:hypothetical protein [Anaerolineae bacterium]
MYFYNARYYDAALGRFIQPDPSCRSRATPPTGTPCGRRR